MTSLSTLPRISWSERASFVLGGVLTLIGAASAIGWFTQSPFLLQPFSGLSPIKFHGALSLILIGITLLSLSFRSKRAFWIALPPALINLTVLAHGFFNLTWQLDEFLVKDLIMADSMYDGRSSTIASCSFLLVSLALFWHGINIGLRTRLFVEAIVGSVTVSIGISTLLGYTASLPAVYMWGTSTALAPVTALGLLVAGAALLLSAWRDSVTEEGGPPEWAPLSAVIPCLTFTLVLWIGLSEREQVYLGAKTQAAMDSVAVSINSEIDRQAKDIEKLSRRWGDTNQNNSIIWEADAHTQMNTSRIYGCESIAYVNTALRTIWVYPTEGNEAHISYSHADDRIRADAIVATQDNNTQNVIVSGTTQIAGKGNGLVIYAPVTRNGQLIGYIAAEYLYAPLIRSIIASQTETVGDYLTSVRIGIESIYSSYSSDSEKSEDLTLEKAYTIFDRRLRLSLTPTKEALSRDRRYLPELALLAGFLITLLLGLSAHFARRAKAGQSGAEYSNKKLLSENEERRRIEARLKVSDERLRLALDSTQIGIFEWNVPVSHVHYSPGLWAMLGYEHSRMPATIEAWQSLIHPDDLPLYQRRVDSQLNGVATFIDPEYRVRSRSGEWRWVYTRSKTVATASGRPTRIMGTVQDTTARREAEQALRESQAEARKLSLVAAKTDNPVIIGSPSGTIEWVNESFTRVMEYTLDEVTGHNPAEFMAGPETDPEVILKIRAAMARGQGLDTDVINYSKSGRKYHLHLEIQPVYNEAEKLENFIAILTDVTVRVETENQLRRAKTEADAASRAKSEFLASMSHEIRTPMNGVIGMTSLLMETPLSVEQRDFVNTIRTSGEALLTIINDILDFSKIESGKMELENMPFELALCIEEAFDLFSLQASAKKLELTYHIESNVPAWIIGDVTRLRQIVVNLVNNAIKFTPSGSISVIIRSLSEKPTNGPQHIEFAVRDTGIGIPLDRLDRLFKAFSQVDSSTTRKYGGTGLGLAISQRLSALMGGDIHAESKLGEGSAFVFTIKTEAAALPNDNSMPPLPKELHKGTILCIEDHPVTKAHLEGIFQQWEVPCLFVQDTQEALAVAADIPSPPALLIIDGDETEGESPLEAVLSLKVPRLLMLPFGQSAPKAPDDKLPFGVMFKPLKTSAVMHSVTQVFRPKSTDGQTASGLNTRRLLAEEYPLDILVVEDNAVNQKVALRFLQRIGYRADAVGNGLEGVTALENRQYDLIFMDLQMPVMDGFEASRQIRRRFPLDQQPKIVALTANAMQGDRELCIAAGMDDYISKPVKLHEIDAAIRRQFGPDAADPMMPKSADGLDGANI